MTYSIYLATEIEKYDFLHAARQAGATLTDVSGCGDGYHITVDATADQADYIDRTRYRADIHDMSADQIRAAWDAGRLTVGQVLIWQTRHGEVI